MLAEGKGEAAQVVGESKELLMVALTLASLRSEDKVVKVFSLF